MHYFKKNILSQKRNINPVISTPTIVGGQENNNFCFGQVNLRINTTESITVNITSNFDIGGSWLQADFLTGGNKITSNLIDSVITSTTFYNFGINGSGSGTGSKSSQIYVEIKNALGDIIDSFVYNRSHNETPC